MLVALTVRNRKPGSYEQFRKAWEPRTGRSSGSAPTTSGT